MSYSEFTEKDNELIQQEFALLRAAAEKRCRGEKELAMIERAFQFANDAHKNIRRRSGEPYMLHPIDVALIVVNDIGLGYKSICAALLHDVVEDTDYTVDDIRERFSDKIASLVDGLTKIKTMLDNEDKDHPFDIYPKSLQAENFKRILLTLNDDVRVVLIKLADRLHNCRTIEFMPEHKRDKILSETMFIFIPLAHRLGLYSIKSEMENIWLRYKEPDAYQYIQKRIDENVSGKKEEMEQLIASIDEALRKMGLNFTIRSRVKTPYSVWKKMNTKNIPFDEVYDLYAIRIVLTPPEGYDKEKERNLCFDVFRTLSGLYGTVYGRYRDWIKNPKPNGYEALHTTLMSPRGMRVEVQIRTKRMDDIAEKGIAAHWAYKREGFVSENDSEMDKWLEKVQDIIVNPDVNALELLDIIHKDLTSTEITVFTPRGDRRSIDKDATALDFAYLIHTEIGNSAIAAKVNMRLVPLSTQLASGDRVEIITAEDSHPKREWLQFLKTGKARARVIDYFRGDRAQSIEFGEKMLREQCLALGYRFDDETIRLLLTHYQNVRGKEEFFYRIGIGQLSLSNLPEQLKNLPSSRRSGSFFSRFFRRDRDVHPDESARRLVIGGSDERQFVIASCCNPIPGDPVVGFQEADGTVTVHKKACPIAEERASKEGDKMLVPAWEKPAEETSFLVRLTLQGIDRVGLLSDISRYISIRMGVNMRRLSLNTDEGIFDGFIDLYVTNKDLLEEMMERIRNIDGIQSVIRTDL